MKALNEDLQMRSDWWHPDLHRRRAPEGRRRRASRIRRKSPKRCSTASSSPPPIPATSSSIPFFGTGTTGAVAKRLGRRFIGIEREPDYRAAAEARLAAVRRLDSDALAVTTPKRTEPRVAFGQLVERGLLAPGEILHSLNGRREAKIRADGTLIASDVRGSIHQVGAALEGAPSCNGWTYWHFRRDGISVPIDFLRQQIRAEMQD